MAKLIVEEQKDYSLIPTDSILLLKVDELKEIELNGNNGPWTKLEIKFKVLGIQAVGDGTPAENYEDIITGPIWGSVPLRLTDSPENKLRQWAEAILGVQLGVGFELDTDMFAGRTVRGITSQYKKKQPDSQGRPIFKHQVDSLLPAGDTSAQQFAAPVQQQQYQQPQQQQAPQQGSAYGYAGQTQQYQQPQQPQQAQPQYQQPLAPAGGVADPWATPGGGSDEPPF